MTNVFFSALCEDQNRGRRRNFGCRSITPSNSTKKHSSSCSIIVLLNPLPLVLSRPVHKTGSLTTASHLSSTCELFFIINAKRATKKCERKTLLRLQYQLHSGVTTNTMFSPAKPDLLQSQCMQPRPYQHHNPICMSYDNSPTPIHPPPQYSFTTF